MPDMMIGDAVKALGSGKVGGYLVRFSTRRDPDLTGDYFTKSTDFDIDDPRLLTVYYQHGQDPVMKKKKLGKAQVWTDDVGVWVEAQLTLADEYDKAIYQMVEAGKLKWSSGSAPHLVEREATGKAAHIKTWPLVEATLTPTPAEPRAAARVIKGVREMEEEENSVQDGRVDALEAQMKQLSQGVETLLKLAQDSPAIRSTPYISDGGSDASGQVVSHPGRPAKAKEIKTFGDFLFAVGNRDKKRLAETYKAVKATANDGMTESVGSEGGYVVPHQFLPALYRVIGEESIVRGRAFPVPMTSRGASFPALDQSKSTYTAGQSNYQAGVVMSWTGEGGTISKTRPVFKKIEMMNHKLAGVIPATMELIEDNNAALESVLIQLFGEAIAFQEDYAFINGDGVAKPLGFLNASACITTATALTAAAPTMPQINTMTKRLWAQGQQRAVWIAHTLLSDAIKNIVQDSGNGLTYMPNLNSTSQTVDGLVPMLDGKKVLLSEKMPATFADGGLALVDLQHYAVGTRQTIEVSYSEHIFFETAELAWRAISRCDGQPRITGPVKIGSAAAATVSPFVKSQ